ncbi:hypothetical protein L208DRAFT_1378631 [Tricholoma matsutake]|nr:hypothetical protein L208DRAFT_1378631 [Tricholoma matsutake 945]
MSNANWSDSDLDSSEYSRYYNQHGTFQNTGPVRQNPNLTMATSDIRDARLSYISQTGSSNMQQGTGTSCLSGGHHSWDMFLDQKSSRDPSPANFSTAITTASHDTLLCHGNMTYTRLNELYIQAKYELEAQKPAIPAAIAHAPTSQVDTTSLTIPKCPDPYDADNYPDVCWHENDWILHGEKQRNGGNTVSKLDFLTDHDGHTLSEKHIKVITDSARQAWMQLYYHQLDPTSWKKKAEDAKQYFNAVMKAEFPEF